MEKEIENYSPHPAPTLALLHAIPGATALMTSASGSFSSSGCIVDSFGGDFVRGRCEESSMLAEEGSSPKRCRDKI